MADDDDLEYSETNVGSTQGQGVRKNISIKLKGKGRGRGRKSVRGKRSGSSKKTVGGSGEDDDQTQTGDDLMVGDTASDKQLSESIDLDEVISKLETPSFSPMERVFPEPLHQSKKLRWNHKVNLIGEKVVNPMIHCCEKCSLPILNYGRMIPCKHVFCYQCAKKADKTCLKCEDSVQRVEQTPLGTVFMCTFGGSSRLGPVSCGRTYLSQRDLQAHVNHRHKKPPAVAASTTCSTNIPNNITHSTSVSAMQSNVNLVPTHSRDPRDPRGHVHEILSGQNQLVGHVSHSHVGHAEHRDQGDHPRAAAVPSAAIASSNQAAQPRQYPHSPASYPSSIPVSSARPNLITVPIQDDSSSAQHAHPQQYTPASGASAHSIPQMQQPQQHAPGSYPPPHAFQHPIAASTPTYSQAPPITTQTFSQHPPPVHHPPPPLHAANVPLFSTPPPPPVHHPPQATYSTPPVAPHTSHTMLPQRFPGGANYDESAYLQPWNSAAVPPPARAPMPPPRPIANPPAPNHNLSHIAAHGPSDQAFRPPYYQ